MTGLDVLHRELTLPLEWRLGAGGLARWAPDFPSQLELPGFRDAGTFLGQAIDPVFAISLLDKDGRPLEVRACQRNWNPARLELKYRLSEALVTERRTVLSLDAFISQWTMSHAGNVSKQFWLVLWSRRSGRGGGQTIAEIEANPQGISFQETRSAPGSGTPSAPTRWGCAMGANFDADSWSVNSAQSADGPILWETSPLYDLMGPGGLPGHVPTLEAESGHLFFALAYPFEIAPGEKLVVHFAAAFASEIEQARANLEAAVSHVDPIQWSEEEWINWFEEAPSFTCSDAMLQRAYWHRWANRKIAGALEWSGDEEAEEVTAKAPVDRRPDQSLAAAIETAWHHSAELSTTELRSLVAQPDEELDRVPWAHAARKVLSIHPDDELLRELTARASRPSNGMERGGSRQSLRLESSLKQALVASPPSLARIVFAYDAALLMEWGTGEEEGGEWTRVAEEFRRQIESTYWNQDEEFYLDTADARGGAGNVKTPAGFYPLLAGLVDAGRRDALLRHLCDPDEFWTRYPLPSISRDDPDFNPDGNWRNQRLDLPRHGRVWPLVNSLVIDGFGRAAESLTSVERAILAELLRRTIELDFIDGDIDRPGCFEHYHPLSGQPSQYRGRAGQPGGWLIDHLLRYVAGIRPDETGRLLVDPLPMRLEWFSVRRAFVGDHEIEVDWDLRAGLTVRIDDQTAGHATVGQALSILLPDHWPAE